MPHVSFASMACVIGLLTTGCDEKGEGLRYWRSSDHDQLELTNATPSGRQPQQPGLISEPAASVAVGTESPHRNDGSIAAQAMRTWAQNCVRCHGQIGGGDGPEGTSVNATELNSLEWQRSVTDEQIAERILKGKGKMPAFTFESDVLSELVNLLRRMAIRNEPFVITTPSPQTSQSNASDSVSPQ